MSLLPRACLEIEHHLQEASHLPESGNRLHTVLRQSMDWLSAELSNVGHRLTHEQKDICSIDCMQDDQDTKSRAAKSGKPATAASKRTAGGVDNAKATKAADQQRQAQLEMLMLDDNALQDMARIGSHLVVTHVWCL